MYCDQEDDNDEDDDKDLHMGWTKHLSTLLAAGPLICTYHVSSLLVNPVCSPGA